MIGFSYEVDLLALEQAEAFRVDEANTRVGALCVYRCNAGRSEEKFFQKQ